MEKLTQTNYVDLAEKVIVKDLERDKRGNFRLTNSKIRNILSHSCYIKNPPEIICIQV